jgi:hypothetical protein
MHGNLEVAVEELMTSLMSRRFLLAAAQSP